jgi:hypothetical protein
MARGRDQLSEKLERIMVQSQLMGLTTGDMIKIANRMRALDAERDFKTKVNEITAGMSWTKVGPKEYDVTDAKGLKYSFRPAKKKKGQGWYNEYWDIVVTHPGTRMKPKEYPSQTLSVDYNEKVRLCPDKDKLLYRILFNLYRRRWQ